ncbi:MAG: LuxR C-terminal-related transcriptional regulator [Coriobacteriales bacterium]|jgi:DNA-binding CsgD family transcriptional regulator|nr:LuxR C-terminal-related transcriptional regulator [Coriobacteriales bacterium]
MVSRTGKSISICLGYALLTASAYMCLHSPTAFAAVLLPSRDIWSYYLLVVLLAQLSVFVAGLFIRHSLTARSRQILITLASIVMVLAVAGIFLVGRMGAAALAPPYVGIVLIALGIGAGFAFFNLCWAQVFTQLEARSLYRLVILSYLIGLVIYLPVTLMPQDAVVPVIICAVLASAFLLNTCDAKYASPASQSTSAALQGAPSTVEGSPHAVPPSPHAVPPSSAHAARVSASHTVPPSSPHASSASASRAALQQLWRPVLCTAVFGFMSGLMLEISRHDGLSLGEFQQVSIIASLIVVAILLLPALILARPLDITSAYRISLPISAAGFLLLPFLFDALSGITIALVHMGLMTVSIVLWCLLATTAHNTGLPAHRVFGACLAATTLALLAGNAFGLLQGAFLTQSVLSLAAVALVSIYLLSMLSLVFFRGQGLARETRSDKASAENPLSREKFYLESCRQIATDAGLTPREAEMLPLLGSGRSIARMAELLFISENTAKSHVKSIYSKLGVHSKQELIDLVSEKTAASSTPISSQAAPIPSSTTPSPSASPSLQSGILASRASGAKAAPSAPATGARMAPSSPASPSATGAKAPSSAPGNRGEAEGSWPRRRRSPL